MNKENRENHQLEWERDRYEDDCLREEQARLDKIDEAIIRQADNA